MIFLTDNDIVLKLACCDLLQEFCEFLESPPNQIFVLPELRFQVKNRLKNNNAAIEKVELFLATVEELPVAKISSLEKFSSLDVGEQRILAVFFENSNKSRLVTGDKRAIKDLSKLAQGDSELYSMLVGKVNCLERIILSLIEIHGFDFISSKVTPNKHIDGVLKIGFGRSEAHAKDALNSYLDSLKSEIPFL